jgi:hypothetical protein
MDNKLHRNVWSPNVTSDDGHYNGNSTDIKFNSILYFSVLHQQAN